MSLVTGLFFPVLLLNQRLSPPLRLPASHCSTFRNVWCSKYSYFCNESIEYFPGTASKFFLKLLVTIPVAPIITGINVHFRFHIRCISIRKLLYFNFFSASFCTTLLLLLLLSSSSSSSCTTDFRTANFFECIQRWSGITTLIRGSWFSR